MLVSGFCVRTKTEKQQNKKRTSDYFERMFRLN